MVLGTATNKSNISISEGVFPNGGVLESQFELEHTFPPFVLRDRSAENHIMIEDPHVSRRHARIARWGDELFVGDEGSKQGTSVNGMQIICAKLKHGDVVNIGASQNPQASIVAIEEETITDFLKASI